MPNLTLSLLNSQALVGDTVYVGISVDTETQPIRGIDVIIDTSLRLTPLAYYPTSLMPVKNYISLTARTINFSLLLNGGEAKVVKGLLAVIECRALSKGYANLRFDFTLGDTTDTNLAADTGDILTKVTNKRVTIK